MNLTDLAARCLKYGHVLRLDLPHGVPYWWVHHEKLCEQMGNPYERIEYILDHKPEHEVARRLDEMRPMTGPEALALFGERQDITAKWQPEHDDITAKRQAERDAITAKRQPERDAITAKWAKWQAERDAITAKLAARHHIENPNTKASATTIFPEGA